MRGNCLFKDLWKLVRCLKSQMWREGSNCAPYMQFSTNSTAHRARACVYALDLYRDTGTYTYQRLQVWLEENSDAHTCRSPKPIPRRPFKLVNGEWVLDFETPHRIPTIAQDSTIQDAQIDSLRYATVGAQRNLNEDGQHSAQASIIVQNLTPPHITPNLIPQGRYPELDKLRKSAREFRSSIGDLSVNDEVFFL